MCGWYVHEHPDEKMEQYANDQGIGLDIKAVGLMDYQDYAQDYDVILLGPQVSYKLDSVKESVSKPVATIPAMDYAMGVLAITSFN